MRYVVKFYYINSSGLPVYVAWDRDNGVVVAATANKNQDRVRIDVNKLNNGTFDHSRYLRTYGGTVTATATNYLRFNWGTG